MFGNWIILEKSDYLDDFKSTTCFILETIINFNTSSLLSESILQRSYNIPVFPYRGKKNFSSSRKREIKPRITCKILRCTAYVENIHNNANVKSHYILFPLPLIFSISLPRGKNPRSHNSFQFFQRRMKLLFHQMVTNKIKRKRKRKEANSIQRDSPRWRTNQSVRTSFSISFSVEPCEKRAPRGILHYRFALDP